MAFDNFRLDLGVCIIQLLPTMYVAALKVIVSVRSSHIAFISVFSSGISMYWLSPYNGIENSSCILKMDIWQT